MANGRSKLSDRNLLQAACHEFQKVDTYHRGLITSANFAKALETLGFKYGQPEVDEILQYCTVTDDGYVHYKELHNALSPDQPRAKQSSMKTTIYPNEASEIGLATSGERNGFFIAKTEDIRKVFALWERGRISSEQFKEALQRCGAPMTPELDRLLLMYGPARSMPFSKLMYALQIDANDGRRARNAHGVVATHVDQAPTQGAGAATVQLQSEQQRFHQSSSSRQEKDRRSDLANPSSLRQVICDFVDGHIPAVTFRMQLQRFGVLLTQDLDKMIRTHEGDSSVRFQDFARLLLRQDKTSGPSGPGTPSGYRSVTPRSDAIFARSGGSSVRSSLPFASGGQWDQVPDVESQPSQRPSVVSVAPPYATQEAMQDEAQPWRPSSTSRAQGHHGDILGWNHAPLREEQKGPTGKRHVAATSGQSFLQWPAESQDEEGPRPGRRLYGQPAAASESAPYGRSSDISQRVPDPRMAPVPFGTDQDLRLRRPEDAGTDEYRAALGGLRR